MSDFVDTTQKHLRHKDGRLRRCVEGDNIIEDGWSIVVPLLMRDHALDDWAPVIVQHRMAMPDPKLSAEAEAALDECKRRNASAWQSAAQRATNDHQRFETADEAYAAMKARNASAWRNFR